MPHVEADMADGFKLTEGTDGRYTLVWNFDCQDLEGIDAVDTLAQALRLVSGGDTHTGDDVPERDDLKNINGHALYCKSRDLQPFPPNDARVITTWNEDAPSTGGYGPTQVEVGSTVEQAQSDFNAANLALPFASRTPITVLWDPTVSGTPTAAAIEQGASAPIFVGKPFRRYTRETSVNPEANADLFVGATNSITWKGLPAETAMIVSYTGRNSGDGKWVETIDVARDPEGKFRQVVRATDPASGQPVALTAIDITNGNGIKEEVMQKSMNFNLLGL